MPQGTNQTRKTPIRRPSRGFRKASKLVEPQVRAGGESRGFAVSRLLTHWHDIVGADLAKMAHPVDVRYGREGLGATLTLLCKGAVAPMVEMQKERLREKVNACYGYAAISRVKITQTAPVGFAEPQAAFEHAKPGPSPAAKKAAETAAADIENSDLRDALASLGSHILTKPSP